MAAKVSKKNKSVIFVNFFNAIFMNLRITCVQSDVITRDPEGNFRHFDDMLKDVKDTDIIILPETFTTGFPADPDIFAEDLESGSPTLEWMRAKAAEKDAMLCGSFLTKRGGKFYNSFVWMRPDGEFHVYDKRHAFTMGGELGIDGGSGLITIEYKGWRIRPFVCYDLRFPVWNRNTFHDGKFEYDLAVFTAEWPEKKANLWTTLLTARAIENQAYVVGVNRVGIDDSDITYRGDCMITNAKGRVVAKAGEGECVFTTELDKEELDAFRSYFVVAKDWDGFEVSR